LGGWTGLEQPTTTVTGNPNSQNRWGVKVLGIMTSEPLSECAVLVTWQVSHFVGKL
jgi:hypothetical protein